LRHFKKIMFMPIDIPFLENSHGILCFVSIPWNTLRKIWEVYDGVQYCRVFQCNEVCNYGGKWKNGELKLYSLVVSHKFSHPYQFSHLENWVSWSKHSIRATIIFLWWLYGMIIFFGNFMLQTPKNEKKKES
jgi:hypothetical protein